MILFVCIFWSRRSSRINIDRRHRHCQQQPATSSAKTCGQWWQWTRAWSSWPNRRRTTYVWSHSGPPTRARVASSRWDVTCGQCLVLHLSSPVQRFLFNTFAEKHRPTVEDLFTKDFSFGTLCLKASIPFIHWFVGSYIRTYPSYSLPLN